MLPRCREAGDYVRCGARPSVQHVCRTRPRAYHPANDNSNTATVTTRLISPISTEDSRAAVVVPMSDVSDYQLPDD